MQLTSKVDYEFTLKLNLREAQDLLQLLDNAGGYGGDWCNLYDALRTEFYNLKLENP
jgi:hypothetical protein